MGQHPSLSSVLLPWTAETMILQPTYNALTHNLGTLKGFDQTINLILDESHERVFSSTQGVEQVVLGLYIVRGDNLIGLFCFRAVIGEIDEETDSTLDLGNIRAEPLNSVVH
uniref:U6 snRNA-associated Sm-like protein LSm8 n=1 Tax=Poecilia reticulata TaxID=8081 RepID=A0A3P9NF21_POERE